MDAQATKVDEEIAPAEWAHLEIFGHREHFGLIREVERFGTKLLEVREFGVEDLEPYRVHHYGGAAIFSLTPCTEEYARRSCDAKWRYIRRRGKEAVRLADFLVEDGEPHDHGALLSLCEHIIESMPAEVWLARSGCGGEAVAAFWTEQGYRKAHDQVMAMFGNGDEDDVLFPIIERIPLVKR